jgi:hypothetical protein
VPRPVSSTYRPKARLAPRQAKSRSHRAGAALITKKRRTSRAPTRQAPHYHQPFPHGHRNLGSGTNNTAARFRVFKSAAELRRSFAVPVPKGGLRYCRGVLWLGARSGDMDIDGQQECAVNREASVWEASCALDCARHRW